MRILSKEECREIRKLADSKKIYLSGIKNFDGKAETIKKPLKLWQVYKLNFQML